VWILGSHNNTYAFAVNDDRFTKKDIANAIIETEAELVRDFCDAYHPERGQFLTTVGVDHGEQVHRHLGQIEAVIVDDQVATPTTATNIKLWRENYNGIFGADECKGIGGPYYNLTNNTIEYVGKDASVRICRYEPEYSNTDPFGTLQISSQWESVLVDGAIPKLARLGVPPELVGFHASSYASHRQRILQGTNYSPEVDIEQRSNPR
jgi:hypothetical protein